MHSLLEKGIHRCGRRAEEALPFIAKGEQKMKKLVVFLMAAGLMIGTMGLVFIAPAGADTIYIQASGTGLIGSQFVGGGDLTRYGRDQPWSVGWTQTGTYTNVS